MSSFFQIYYIETNLLCIIISLYVYFIGCRRKLGNNLDLKAIRNLVYGNILYSCSDLVTGIFRGYSGHFFTVLLYIFNMLYIFMPMFYAATFAAYTNYKLTNKQFFKTMLGRISLIPLIISAILLLSTPYTHFAFYIDNENLYHREFGAYMIPFVGWIFFLVSTIKVIFRILKSGSYQERENLKPIAKIIIWPFIVTCIQLNFYGVTVCQVGFTLATLAFFMKRQNNQILSDEITGLNNRRDFNIYISEHIRNSDKKELYISIIDINSFSKIISTYGYAEGDDVLRLVGEIIKQSCYQIDKDIFFCRYGDDKFIVSNKNNNILEIDLLSKTIQGNLMKEALRQMKDYALSVSIGSAYGIVASNSEFQQLLNNADQALNDDKEDFKNKGR